MTRRMMWAAVAVIALSAVPAAAQERAALADRQVAALSDSTRTDTALARKIAERIQRYANYTIFDDVNIRVDGGVATLSACDDALNKAKDMARLTSRVKGVVEVNNELSVLPVSIHDDQLRASIARQIYRDPVFSRYAIHVNPPIHIVVERGRVTLTGAVNSLIERQKAEIIARQTVGVFGVENQLRIDS